MGGFRGGVRGARGDDHAAFVALFPELGVDDPILDAERFGREVLPNAVVAIRDGDGDGDGGGGGGGDGDGDTVGFGSYRILGTTAHVVHVITSPTARREGVGTAIMRAIGARVAAAGCTDWYLNTLPTNEPAKALYRSLGFTPSFLSQALKVPWSVVDAHAHAHAHPPPSTTTNVVVRAFEPSEEREIERACSLIEGQLATARSFAGRILRVLVERADSGSETIAGVACFDPTFPGVHPFRVARADLALPMLAALRSHARAGDDLVHVVVENRTDVADALLAAGATLRLTTLRMNGSLPLGSAGQ